MSYAQEDPVFPLPADPVPPVDGVALTPPPADEPVSVQDWIITYLILSLPLLGFVMLFVWAFGEGTNPSKANWAKAMLLYIALAVILFLCIGGTIFVIALLSEAGRY